MNSFLGVSPTEHDEPESTPLPPTLDYHTLPLFVHLVASVEKGYINMTDRQMALRLVVFLFC